MEWKALSPMDLQKVIEVIDNSKTFTRSNNIADQRAFCEKLFTEELPGETRFYSFEENGIIYGFIKYCVSFPLPGYTHLRLLVIKENECGKGIGSEALNQLREKHPGTLWIESLSDEESLPFWKRKGFVEEAGRWVLSI